MWGTLVVSTSRNRRRLVSMSRQMEDRNRQKFAEKMREKSLAAKNAKAATKKTTGGPAAPSGGVEDSKKD